MGERGFTLVEVLVTLAMSAIAVASVLAMQVVTTRTNGGSASAAEAVAVAERTIEEARGLSLAAMFVEYEDDGALPIDWDFGGATVTGRTTTFLRRILVDAVDADENLIRVRVEVRWSDDGADPDRQVALEVLRTRQEAL